LFFNDQDFDGQLLRAVSYTAYGGADIGECLETASHIKEGDRDSWYEAWTKTADRMKADAQESLKGATATVRAGRRSSSTASSTTGWIRPWRRRHRTRSPASLNFGETLHALR
jgi:hypothetical protein